VNAGFRLLRFTAADVYGAPDSVAMQVRQALAAKIGPNSARPPQTGSDGPPSLDTAGRAPGQLGDHRLGRRGTRRVPPLTVTDGPIIEIR
jgi:hypothetical protein